MDQGAGTIAALQFRQRPPLDFADIVEEFDIAFQTGATHRCLTWDCDDVAIFDRESLRIALGWMQPQRAGEPWYLIVAVGPAPGAPDASDAREFCEELASHILERTQEYLPYDAVYRGMAGAPVDAALIDTITEQLINAANVEPRAQSTQPALYNRIFSRSERRKTAKPPDFDLRATEEGELDPYGETDELRALRQAINGAENEDITAPMHLSIYALGATMLIQVPPLGAALLVYTMLREEFTAAA